MLAYTRGETKGIVLELVSPAGRAHDFTGYSQVTAAIAASASATPVLTRDSDVDGADKLAIAASPATVTIYPTAAESALLSAGSWLVSVWVTIDGARIHFAAELAVSEGAGT